MLRLTKILATFSLLMLLLALGCGEADEEIEAEIAINEVITDRWQKGYMTKDLSLYESAYWAESFLYHADMGTPADTTDDLIFDDLRRELESAQAVFEKYQDIKIEVSQPEIAMLDDVTAMVRQHYEIEGFVTDGTLVEGGFVSWHAEGDSEFTFERRGTEWRIREWLDKAVPVSQL
jgi:hypothetical protein